MIHLFSSKIKITNVKKKIFVNIKYNERIFIFLKDYFFLCVFFCYFFLEVLVCLFSGASSKIILLSS